MNRKFLCATGLSLLIIGQVILSLGSEFVFAQRPVDFAHWFLLTGAVFMLAFSTVPPKNTIDLIGTIITIIGITAFVGMCTIDFLLWSLQTEISKNEFVNQLYNTPSVSLPFITVGPSFLYIGLTIQSLNYLKTNSRGFILTVIGTLVIGFGQMIIHQRMTVIFGHVLLAIGLVLILYVKQKPPHQG